MTSSNRSSSFGDYVFNTKTPNRQTDRQTDGNGRLLFSYSRGHETSRKYKSAHSSDGLDYYTSLDYLRSESKNSNFPDDEFCFAPTYCFVYHFQGFLFSFSAKFRSLYALSVLFTFNISVFITSVCIFISSLR